jgi:serine phosphatase RsbU (regulator of sigma subunit)
VSARDAYIDFILRPWHFPDGAIAGLLAYMTDGTERVRERQAAQRQAAEAQRRYEQALGVIDALQRELLPAGLPVLPGVQIAGSYLLAEADTAAGGNWFDAIPLAGGRVGLVVGDVVRHGVAASAVLGQLRAVLAERLGRGAELPAALASVDWIARRVPGARAATVCVAVLDPADGSLCYCTAGHPPPLLVPAQGEARYLPATGAGPLGTGSAFPVETNTLDANVLLLYSDGILERPGREVTASTVELAQVAADTTAGRALDTGESSSPCPTPPAAPTPLTPERSVRPSRDAAHRLAQLPSLLSASFRKIVHGPMPPVGPPHADHAVRP